jgi:hypothetical protein
VFGGPATSAQSAYVAAYTSWGDSCVGLPDSGYVTVLESFDTRIKLLPGGCGGNDCGGTYLGSGSSGGSGTSGLTNGGIGAYQF